jgi:crotonobetainyl-CoA:carnitine CoA-transferase CaiB-like acyl-CoA transferase
MKNIASAPLLDGLVVLDFTRVLAGPYCTRLLADLGARVIKIERPVDGDDTRAFYLQLEEGRTDQSSYFVRFNAGKESVAIDLAHPSAREVVLDLAKKADVLVENFVPGVMARHGIDYAAVSAVNPAIVYCSISGYGQTGPLRDRPAFAHLINAASGAMDLDRQGAPEPRVSYLQSADALAGVHAFGLVLAAVNRVQRTGQGAYLDVSMLQSLWGAEDIGIAAALNGGAITKGPRPGMIIHAIGGRQLAVQFIGGGPTWDRLLGLMGTDGPAGAAKFASPQGRRDHWPELRQIICDWLDRFESVEAAVQVLSAARVMCAPVRTMEEVIADPHMEAREAFTTIPHAGRGEVRVTAAPFFVDGAAVPARGAAPHRAGEHSRAVLGEVLGYAEGRVEELIQSGVVAAP